MREPAYWIPMTLVMIVPGLVYFLMPLIARRGLLFGAYVGEQGAISEEARRITRRWYVGMTLWLAASIAAGLLAGFSLHPAAAPPTAFVLLMAGYVVEYLRAYWKALQLAPAGPPPAAAVIEGAQEASRGWLPWMAFGLGVAGGLFAIGYAWFHYGELPAMVPTHFGPSGRPDAWRPRSFFTVMLTPILTLLMGTVLGGVALLVAHAKRAIRHPDQGASFRAQQRFRSAMSRFLAVVAILTTLMLVSLGVSAIRVGLGESPGLSPSFMILAVLMLLCAIGGILYIALRYGQGGSRLEREAAGAPLTDGLADNRNWVLGAFYVNRDDPSLMVEHRFGLGYTLNLGNPKAMALLAGFLGLVLLVVVVAILTN